MLLSVAFSALSGGASSIGGVVGAGWGLGNALFIATALTAIEGAASGGAVAAIAPPEPARGLGVSVAPLTGGYLRRIS